ncbi:MAG: acetamidase/formamidase family protein [Polaromonas sp.]|nr:acetamidase/formamidase family protein [Gemmatimonadaceae bacterium]
MRARFRGVAKDGRLTGIAIGTDRKGVPNDTAEFFATLQPVRSGPPRTLAFEPTVFHRNFSRSIAPALRIFPGDTVQTRTVDAGGVDWNGVKRTAGGNPQTGPFYIEGTVPGDVIAIHLHRVRLNRDFASAGASIVSGAITPGLARGLPDIDDFNARWTLDRTRGVARLAVPTKALAAYEIPLRPMMGCIGVAPAQRQSIRTQDSGPFGGNMDYNELREGTTIYLTVNTPGALLFIGDGHAAQADGELSGDALETSMDVVFSVDIVRGMANGGPRAESAEYRMSIGIAGDLQEALRLATSDMTRWLAADYKLNAAELASVLGTAMRYDVADMVGTQISVVARIRKQVLRSLTPAR